MRLLSPGATALALVLAALVWAALVVAAALGVILSLAERYAPVRVRAWIPSATGVGVAMVMPGWNAISFFIGGLIAEVLRRKRPEFAERTVVSVASGLVAGESLMGIFVAILVASGLLGK